MKQTRYLLMMALMAFSIQLTYAQTYLNWANTIGSMTEEIANDMVVDSDENIYIVGELHGPVNMNPHGTFTIAPPVGNLGVYLAKYDKTGAFIWAIALDADSGTEIDIDLSGTILIAGTFTDTATFGSTSLKNTVSSTTSTIYIASFDKTTGAFRGGAVIEGNGNQKPLDMKATGSGIILAGTFTGTADFDITATQANRTQAGTAKDLFLAKFVGQGNLSWVKTIATNSTNTTIDDIESDAAGNIYAVGRLWESLDFQNGTNLNGSVGVRPESFIFKIAPDASYQWDRAGSHSGSIDRSGYYSLELDTNGDLTVAGFVQGTVTLGGFNTTTVSVDSTPNILVAKYAPDGTAISNHVLGGDDQQFALTHTLDSEGNYIIAGIAGGPGNDFDPDPNVVSSVPFPIGNQVDVFIAKYNSDLTFQWAGGFIGSTLRDWAHTVAASPEGNIYISGYVQEDVDFDFDATGVVKNGITGGRDLYIASLHNVAVYNQNINLCFGTTVQVGSSTYDAVGSYQDVFTGARATGQDSVVNTTILSLLDEITLSATLVKPTCFSASDGSVTITASDAATRNYQYSIDGITGQSSPTFTGLAAGNYTVFVQDKDGCTSSIAVELTEPAVLTISTSLAPLDCNGDSDGSINIDSVVGGTGPYTYSIDGTNFVTTSSFSNLEAGAYTITIKDANGCTATRDLNLTNPVLLEAAIADQQNILCAGSNTGSIVIGGTGGTGNHSYSIDGVNFQAQSTFTGLVAGDYTATVKDANNCTATVNTTVTEPTAINPAFEHVNVTCNGADDGQIGGAASGGVGPYTYSLDGTNFQTTIFDGLAPANYTLTIRDANNCTATTDVTITEPSVLTMSAQKTDVTCNGEEDGTIVISAGGGTTGGGALFINNVAATSSSFSGLAAGTYDFRLLDANMCEATLSVTITEPDALTVTATATNASCNTADDGQITLAGAGGTGPYEYALDGTNFQAAASFSSLAPENYTITIRDANGCTATTSATITAPDALMVTVTLTNFNTITATASGGTAPYEYSIESTFQSSGIFSSLSNGNYTVTVRDANGCTMTASQALVVTSVDEPVFIPTVRSYPNPAQDYLVISEVAKGDIIRMVSIEGKTINQNTINKAQTNYRQDISTMEGTLFVLVITDESGRIKLRQKVLRVN